MIEKVSKLAENVATKVGMSRRGFFGHFARWAGRAAVLVGAVVALPRQAKADWACFGACRNPCISVCLFSGGTLQQCAGPCRDYCLCYCSCLDSGGTPNDCDLECGPSP
jgi:hypothetical protein